MLENEMGFILQNRCMDTQLYAIFWKNLFASELRRRLGRVWLRVSVGLFQARFQLSLARLLSCTGTSCTEVAVSQRVS
ncbi:Keratin, Type Ii Cuticular Hb2 [Manis pentadactyla]|nr:Keratin, Type Ii Cuticular Hb2 [Manis pentadactyla]